jgi:hypothetical protein
VSLNRDPWFHVVLCAARIVVADAGDATPRWLAESEHPAGRLVRPLDDASRLRFLPARANSSFCGSRAVRSRAMSG